MRKPPLNIIPPDTITSRKFDVIEQKRTYELITPLYGGGVEANKADPVTVVRATEIRGQLRFWWRAMRGEQAEGDTSSLKLREDALWGKAYKKGDAGLPPDQTIQIVVDVVREGTAIKPFEMRGSRPAAINDIPGYVAFPLQPDQSARGKATPPIPSLRQGVQFILTITYPKGVEKEVKAALWAWETFGGLGARTRRGFGALHLVAINGEPYQSLPTSREVERWIREQASIHRKAGSFSEEGMPHLGSTLDLAVTPPSANPMQAWNRLIRKLQNFRQQKDANNRSAWPEADTIREAVGKGSASNIKKFPRAAFGLPIIFHFTGSNAPAGNYTLNQVDTERKDQPNKDQPNKDVSNKERFASPLILRPFLCSDKRAVGLALLLEGSRVGPQGLVLQDEKRKPQTVNGQSILNGTLTPSEARTITKKIPDLQNETDVLQAFMKTFKEFR